MTTTQQPSFRCKETQVSGFCIFPSFDLFVQRKDLANSTTRALQVFWGTPYKKRHWDSAAFGWRLNGTQKKREQRMSFHFLTNRERQREGPSSEKDRTLMQLHFFVPILSKKDGVFSSICLYFLLIWMNALVCYIRTNTCDWLRVLVLSFTLLGRHPLHGNELGFQKCRTWMITQTVFQLSDVGDCL